MRCYLINICGRYSPETWCPEVYKERGKERIPYPLFELEAIDDSVLLCESPDYNAGEVVKVQS